jgi:HSP20 family protein
MIGKLTPRKERQSRLLGMPTWEFSPIWERMLSPLEEWWPDGGKLFTPELDVAETDTTVEVSAELPGMKPEEINVEVQNGQLWISGEKKEEKEEKGKTYHRVERRYGSFRRMLPIPASVDPEKVEASFHEGVLKITLAKTEEAKAKHVEVKS